MNKPAYFEGIQTQARETEDLIESHPAIAGAWNQLFEQVQSPRHVVSELLQNADDAGATQAAVTLSEGEFVFSHNGADFTEEHFRSLCRFGYSNKRSLHTIGFRGIGFKSTFSLGSTVRLVTPTLSTAFHRQRFTEPVWCDENHAAPGRTEIRVSLPDAQVWADLTSNLEDWFKSPASLLFFPSIRSLRINERELRWVSKGMGPVRNSEWFALAPAEDQGFLLIRSDPEDFPEEAAEEIRATRQVKADDQVGFPPCRVEIVLGLAGRLFVILPTEVTTKLPFACNAPFLQDPARLKIKDPSTSPTNRWLLERIGHLAAKTTLAWLRSKGPLEERARAYQLLPGVDGNDASLGGECATLVGVAARSLLEKENFLLTAAGNLVGPKGCIAVPPEVLRVWSASQVESYLTKEMPVLASDVALAARKILVKWGCVEELPKASVLDSLRWRRLPKPHSWRQLLTLWSYVATEMTAYYYRANYTDLSILPVQGQEVLYCAKDVVRLGEKKLLQSDEDWAFLATHLLVLNQNWLRFLAEQRRAAEEDNASNLAEQVGVAYKILENLGLQEPGDASRVLERVAGKFYGQQSWAVSQCVQLAQIAAKLNAQVTENFQFVTRNRIRTPASAVILADEGCHLEAWVPADWYAAHTLDEAYWGSFHSCSREEWIRWVQSGRSRILTFPPLEQRETQCCGKAAIRAAVEEHGLQGDLEFPYSTQSFVLVDWDFRDSFWQHWHALAAEQPGFWAHLVGRILREGKEFWSGAMTARAYHVATTNRWRPITAEPLMPTWLQKLGHLPCLEDTWGRCHEPIELLRRGPATEALLDVEPFVRGENDTETNRALLIALGVRDTPTGPEQLLLRLNALSKAPGAPVDEVMKWYGRLDQLISQGTTEQVGQVRKEFLEERIILSSSLDWVRANEVFLHADDDDAPGAALVHPAAAHLTLWTKVGVADRPTADRAIDWLGALTSGAALSSDELRRARALLARYPERVWAACGHWLNLEGEWVPVASLEYSLAMQSLIPWKHLFQGVKRRTADLQKLPVEVIQRHPFTELVPLAQRLEDRLQGKPGDAREPESKPWLATLGQHLQRVILDDEAETGRVRALAARLAETSWVVASDLATVPYLDGEPAGIARSAKVLWVGTDLWVADCSSARVGKAVAAELGRCFDRPEVLDAVMFCYEHSPDFVLEYLEENFRLDTVEKSRTARIPASEVPMELPNTASPGLSESGPEAPPVAIEEDRPSSPLPDCTEGLAGDAEGEPEDPATPIVTQPGHRPPRITGPSLIERFARVVGYSPNGSDRFRHPDGSWIGKVVGSTFPWERCSAAGDVIGRYWVKDHCLESEPLELPAEVWKLCTDFPGTHSLVLSARNGEPIEVSGRRLQEMVDAKSLTLYPATYRLVHK